jgi:hypothetical protein
MAQLPIFHDFTLFAHDTALFSSTEDKPTQMQRDDLIKLFGSACAHSARIVQCFGPCRFLSTAQPYYRVFGSVTSSPLKKVNQYFFSFFSSACMCICLHFQGHPPSIYFVLERRGGNKIVTIVRNLEVWLCTSVHLLNTYPTPAQAYGIDADDMVHDLQKIGSTRFAFISSFPIIPAHHQFLRSAQRHSQ